MVCSNRKQYGIQCVPLDEYLPRFLEDCQHSAVHWERGNEDIYGRIQTFLLLIAHIPFKDYQCYCCIYPHSSASEYIVLLDIDDGTRFLLLTTLRDPDLYPNDSRRIAMLTDGLLLLETHQAELISLRREMPD